MPCNLASQYSSIVVFNQLGERRLIQFSEDVRQPASVCEARREGGSILLAQSSNQRVAVLPADLTILVAMAVVEAWLFHRFPPPAVRSARYLSRFGKMSCLIGDIFKRR